MGSCGAGRRSQPYARRVWPLSSPWLGDSGESGPTACDLEHEQEVVRPEALGAHQAGEAEHLEGVHHCKR